jgi:hypothetical protein
LKQDEANEEIGKSLSEGTTLFEDKTPLEVETARNIARNSSHI